MTQSNNLPKATALPIIPKSRFRDFHTDFFGGTWGNLCSKCKGYCEPPYTLPELMPGEVEFIAEFLKISPDQMRELYLDAILTPFGEVDVVRGKICPFQDEDYQCSITPVKIVMCDIYPIMPRVQEGELVVEADPICPISKHAPVTLRQFEGRVVSALEKLDVPLEWYKAVAGFDYTFDHIKLHKMRGDTSKRKVMTVDQVMACYTGKEKMPCIRGPSLKCLGALGYRSGSNERG